MMIASALVALLIGGWLPGGTWWLTPLASLALVALAFFGRYSPSVFVRLLNGEWRALVQAAGRRGAGGLFRLTLLALPVWLAQCGGWSERSVATRFPGSNEPPLGVQTIVRQTLVAVRVWAESDDEADQYGPVRGYIQTPTARLTLPAQAHDPGPLGGLDPPIVVQGWSWADADLLPEVVVTVYPVLSKQRADRTRTFYVPLLRGDIREQGAVLGAGWRLFQLAFPLLAVAMTFWGVGQVVGGLFGLLRRSSPSKS